MTVSRFPGRPQTVLAPFIFHAAWAGRRVHPSMQFRKEETDKPEPAKIAAAEGHEQEVCSPVQDSNSGLLCFCWSSLLSCKRVEPKPFKVEAPAPQQRAETLTCSICRALSRCLAYDRMFACSVCARMHSCMLVVARIHEQYASMRLSLAHPVGCRFLLRSGRFRRR